MDVAVRVRLPLLLLRLGVFVVMFMWTLDKFLNPKHAAAIFGKFYHIQGLSLQVSYFLGTAELLLLVGFILGFKKRATYGIVFLLHGISTLSSYPQYLSAFQGTGLLFYAAWPMLTACFALYTLRDLDTLWTVSKGA